MLIKKIFIIEDHPIVSKGLSELINKQKDLETCCILEDSKNVINEIKNNNPDMITLDISLKDKNGIEIIKDIKYSYPKLPILVISMHDEMTYAERALKAGANGYIMKEKITKELLKAIYDVLSGKIYLSEKMSGIILNKSLRKNINENESVIDILSDRELEVLQYIAEGLTTREIAEKTFLGIKTVETYKSKIKEKMNLSNSTQLVKFAVEWFLKNT